MRDGRANRMKIWQYFLNVIALVGCCLMIGPFMLFFKVKDFVDSKCPDSNWWMKYIFNLFTLFTCVNIIMLMMGYVETWSLFVGVFGWLISMFIFTVISNDWNRHRNCGDIFRVPRLSSIMPMGRTAWETMRQKHCFLECRKCGAITCTSHNGLCCKCHQETDA